MSATFIDTLAMADRLEAGGFTPRQARALIALFLELASQPETTATDELTHSGLASKDSLMIDAGLLMAALAAVIIAAAKVVAAL